MVFFQALIELGRRSIGRVFQSIFGWSVNVIFGAVGKDERTLLSAAVAGAAFWPVLLAGTVFPRVAAFVLAFVPMHKSMSDGLLRAGWIALAVAVPLFVGWVVERRRVGGWSSRRILSGFPVTLGIAGAFLVAFAVVPIQKLVAFVRGEKAELVPLIVEDSDMEAVSRNLRQTLTSAGFALVPAEPPRLQKVISAILRATSVAAGRGDAAPPRYFRGDRLALTFNANGVDLRGRPSAVLRAHSLIGERATELPALQTTDPEAQELERRIRRVWSRHRAGPGPAVSRELRALARELSVLDCPYDEWEIVYREVLQLHLALGGERQLLAGSLRAESRRERAESTRLAALRRRAAREARAGGMRALDKATAAVGDLTRRLARRLARQLPGTALRLLRRR